MAPFQKLKEKLKELENNKAGRLAGKIGSFFDPEPQKEKVLRHEDFNAAGDVYYADVSVAYKIISRILWLFFVFFLVLSIITNHREITYENFYYLFKDFSNAVDVGNSNYETLSYDSDSRQKFSLYRGGLATVNPSTLSIYTATGRKTIRENINYSSPHIVCSDKYVLVYDSSSTSFSVYNSFSRIFSDTLEYPITDACFASNGRFAIVTRDADSKAVVYIYGKNFKQLKKYGYDEYAFDVALSSERNLLMMLFYGDGEGIGRTELALCRSDDLSEVGTLFFDGEFPIEAFFIEKNRIALITDRAVRIFDEKMNVIESVEYLDSEVVDFCVAESGFALSTLKNAKNQLIVFDKNGKLVYNSYVKYNIMQIGLSKDFAFVNTGDGVARISLKNGKDEFLPSDNGKLLVYNESTALICGEARAEYLVFGRN